MFIEIILTLLAIPSGYLLAWMTKEELVVGRKWFVRIIILGVIVGGWAALTGNYSIFWTCLFIVIVSFISYFKSFDKKFVKK